MLKLITNVSSSTGKTASRILASRSAHQAGRIGSRAFTRLAVRALERKGFDPAPQRFAKAASERLFHTSGILCNEIQTIKCPQLSESLSEGDIRLVKAPGDQVEVDDVVAEVETDKTAIPIHSPVAGVIESFLVEDGATVTPGQDILKIKVGATGGAGPAAAAATAPEPPKVEATPVATPPPSTATPPPVPPRQTEVTKHLSKDFNAPAFDISSPPGSGARTETRVKMNRMRQRIAERLKDAQNTYAMLTTFNEVDMSRLTELRNKNKDAFLKKHGVKLGFMSAFVKASAHALKDQPVVNAVIDGNETIYRDYIDISVAVSTPKGLVVPVIRDADQLDFAGIEKYIAQLGEKAKSGSLAIEDMDGGTFTISNGGVFGSMFGTPIINPPQSAILGMHGIQQRAVVINNEIKIRPMMYICLTYDHRLIDGREAVTFLRKIKDGVEDPATMFLG
ncbi:dihydrolipoyllysine-residue succinyltransferase component of 2-oxoglutarate dehydrogenase complex, mitochondrial [Galendromus occidentalis]|uniref:Dihydrolipoyllysine-residue succinyltransferase component of 2-oxoglutarate dehydrogenase complex, mitochondrial n=1 Tax=Galendromus occidentalis TaxID=34638 RepID=A0AAJ7L483_9ACAR|nr:dihydrolipoyllysine-residue succinyltransferase component of 2-oxoglutarate dehydrogenase complex, mitochondrial [Galendromus occidentalis]